MNGNISNTYTIVPQFQGKYPIQLLSFLILTPLLKNMLQSILMRKLLMFMMAQLFLMKMKKTLIQKLISQPIHYNLILLT